MTEPKSLVFTPPASNDPAAEQPSFAQPSQALTKGVAVAAVTAGDRWNLPGERSVADAGVPYSSRSRGRVL
jgi:hypothetical protein